jgi:hypothetical protein
MLLEVVDPKTPRALATVEKPARHTGLVEKHGTRWYAVDLFPRRNARRDFDWGNFGKDVLQGVHKYVGKPLLGAYGAGAAADWLGDQEDSWIGRDKKKQPEKSSRPMLSQLVMTDPPAAVRVKYMMEGGGDCWGASPEASRSQRLLSRRRALVIRTRSPCAWRRRTRSCRVGSRLLRGPGSATASG